MIQSQNDLYQVDQFVNFFAPWGIGQAFVMLWHCWATLCCFVGAFVFMPVTWAQQAMYERREGRSIGQAASNGVKRGGVTDDRVKELMGFGAEGGRESERTSGQFGNMQVVKPD